MTIRQTLSRALLPAAALLAFAHPSMAAAKTPEAPAATDAKPAPAVPLWKVADEDTTIYLFGTIHLLTADTVWMDERIKGALSSADELVTELPMGAMNDPETQKHVLNVGMLPPGKTLRSMLDPEQLAAYEKTLAGLGLPAQSFDQMEPWLAGMTLTLLPLMKQGYTATSGVELTLEGTAPQTVTRGALETLPGQIALFDGMSEKDQVSFLMSAATGSDAVVTGLAAMVAAWQAGDADKLAELMNKGMNDANLADRLLYARNRNWAEWVESRLAKPGTVFIAVGAGHLAGTKSVQDYLDKEGVKVTRIR